MFLFLGKNEHRICCLGPNACMEVKTCDIFKISQHRDLSVSTALDIGEVVFCLFVEFFLFGFFVYWLVYFVLVLFSSGTPSNLFVYMKCSRFESFGW